MNGAFWRISFLPIASVGLAFLEADAVLVGQWMLSRPILLGPLVGLACGQFRTGMLLGAINELFSLDEKPMGSIVPLNVSIATGCAVLLCAGPCAVPAEVSLPAGLGLGLGHKWIESAIRTRRAVLTRQAERGLAQDARVDWAGILLRGIGVHVALTSAFIYGSVALSGPALSWAWARAPQALRGASAAAFLAAPWIGLSSLIHVLARKE